MNWADLHAAQLRRVLCYWFLVVASQVEEWQKYVVGISEPNRKFILLKIMAMCRSPEIPSDVPAQRPGEVGAQRLWLDDSP